MEISIFDVIGNGISNEELIEIIENKLQEKYKKEFKIKKIGNRYGTYTNDTVTTYCCPKDDENMMFTAKLNKEKTVLEDDYLLRKVSYELEENIKKEFRQNNIEVIVKNKIIGKNQLQEFLSVQEFIDKHKGTNFLAYIISSQKISNETLKNIYEKLEQKYNGIHLKTLIYVINEEQYKECCETIKQSPTITETTIEKFVILEENIIKIQDGKIYKIK